MCEGWALSKMKRCSLAGLTGCLTGAVVTIVMQPVIQINLQFLN
jgi:hypothetical protein